MRHAMVALLGALVCGAVQAGAVQAGMVQVDRVDPGALACLTRPATLPTYPAGDSTAQRPGMVRLSLRFVSAEQAPEVVVLFKDASDAMVSAVQAHAQAYRLPCLSADAPPVLAVQEFSFAPGQGDAALAGTPRAVPLQLPNAPTLTSCLRVPAEAPATRTDAFQKGNVANAVIEATFTGVDAEPEVKVLYASVGKLQLRELTRYMQEHRLTCMPGGGKFATVERSYRYALSDAGGTSTQFKFKSAVPLGSFLRGIKNIQAMRTEFNFGTMSCPFQVAWTMGRPALDNRVVELGPRDLNRTEFLAWLGGLEMNAPGSLFESLLGETIVIDVPCERLVLTGQG